MSRLAPANSIKEIILQITRILTMTKIHPDLATTSAASNPRSGTKRNDNPHKKIRCATHTVLENNY